VNVAEHNLHTYESEQVVSFYERQADLQPCETYLFRKYIRPGAAVLDMGVGGGRTTQALSSTAGRYVGADYSRAMVDACARRYPGLEFRHCDATQMTQFASGEFDVMVFSFNGIDYITDGDARARCLAEASRVLRDGGVFIFSSHNARQLGIWPVYQGASASQAAWRTVRALGKSAVIAGRTLRSGAYVRGEGYIRDPVHGGGIRTYVSTPAAFRPQLARTGLRIVEIVRGPHPDVRADALTSWHYYACRKELLT
jgi:SAM-dependent methyltransferase